MRNDLEGNMFKIKINLSYLMLVNSLNKLQTSVGILKQFELKVFRKVQEKNIKTSQSQIVILKKTKSRGNYVKIRLLGKKS